jgi:RNA polymerase sigma factor (sigma-70 family)
MSKRGCKNNNQDYNNCEYLFLRMAENDSEAWRIFLKNFGDKIYSHIFYLFKRYGLLNSRIEVDDVIQGFLLSLMEKGGRKLLLYKHRKEAKAITWLRVVATNHFFKILREYKHILSAKSMDDPEDTSIINKLSDDFEDDWLKDIESNEIVNKIKEIVDKFKEREKSIFNYYYLNELSRDEIAKKMDLEPNYVDLILYRIREELKSQMKKYKNL